MVEEYRPNKQQKLSKNLHYCQKNWLHCFKVVDAYKKKLKRHTQILKP